MERRDAVLAEQTRALLAEHGIPVTEEGIRRAGARLRGADKRTTAADWQRLREVLDAASL